MRHVFRLKKSVLKTVINDKIGINSISIENGDDVESIINTILIYIKLDDTLTPTACSYNFINNLVCFHLELKPEKDKMAFFDALKE